MDMDLYEILKTMRNNITDNTKKIQVLDKYVVEEMYSICLPLLKQWISIRNTYLDDEKYTSLKHVLTSAFDSLGDAISTGNKNVVVSALTRLKECFVREVNTLKIGDKM